MNRALLLNASFEPHSVVRDRDAVMLYLEDLVDVIEYSGEEFHSPSMTVLVPSVMKLRKYVVMPEKHRSIMLITPNVLARDNHECAYCGKHADTMDHIVPRALGGPHRWVNVTAACRKCNHKKSDRTLEQMGWTLNRKPYRPKGVAAHLLKIRPDPSWEPYLQVQ
jgi:5-methylcytosine-specific restriction endonuclease McrA